MSVSVVSTGRPARLRAGRRLVSSFTLLLASVSRAPRALRCSAAESDRRTSAATLRSSSANPTCMTPMTIVKAAMSATMATAPASGSMNITAPKAPATSPLRASSSRRPPLRGSWIAAASMRTPMAIAQAATTYRSAFAEMSFQTSSAMPIAVPATASSISHPRSARGSGAENAARPDRTPLTSAYTATTATMVVRPMSGHRTSTKPNRMAATPFAAMSFQTRASMRSPSLAASSILLLTFDSKVSVGVDSVVMSSSSSGTSRPPRGPSARGRRALP